MWVTFSLRAVLRIALLMAVLGLAATYHSGICHSATITIQAGQNRQEATRDEQTSADMVSLPMTGNTTFVGGQWIASRLYGQDGLNLYPMTDFAVVYDGKAAATPEVSTWWMIVTGGLLITVKITTRRYQLVKAHRAAQLSDVAC